jgi:hypothetical protein
VVSAHVVIQEVVVPLSENEQRLLEQMERALYAEDPGFASTMRGVARRAGAGRRLAIGSTTVILGLLFLALALFQPQYAVPLSVVGFLLMLVGTVYAISRPRRSGPTGVVGEGGKVRFASRRKSGTFMQRMEQRWDRRREEG